MDRPPIFRKKALGTLLGLTLLPLPAFTALDTNLPDMGDSSGSIITPVEESRLGRGLYDALRQDGLVLDDTLLVDYIEGLGERIISSADVGESTFTFFIVDKKVINAFAAPGGFIAIFTGLIEFADSENELAAVMAHETAHILQRHMARAYEDADKFGLPYAVAILSAILLARSSNQGIDAVVAGGLAGSAQHSINFTRANEEEADRQGIKIMAAAGFDPHAMGGFFARLERESRYYGEQAPEFLRTHPVNSSRVSDALGRANQFGKIVNPDPTVFLLMRARLQVLKAPSVRKLLEDTRTRLDQKPDDLALRYRYALLLNKLKRSKEAAPVLLDLLKSDEARVPYYLALAEARENTQQLDLALTTVKKGLGFYPGNHPLVLKYAEIQIRKGEPDAAVETLKQHIREGNKKAQTWALLSEASEKAGNRTAAHEALAEKHFYSGDLGSAIQQMKQAQKAAGDNYYESSRIAARLRQWQEQSRVEKKNKDK